MPKFRYEALDSTGRAQTGEIEADEVSQAVSTLQARQLVVLSIQVVLPGEANSEFTRSSSVSQPNVAAPNIAESRSANSLPPKIDAPRGPAGEELNQDYEERLTAILREPTELISMLEALAAEPASAGLRKRINYLLKKLRSGVDARQFLYDERLCSWLPVVMSTTRESDNQAVYSKWLKQILDERTRRMSFIMAFASPVLQVGFVLLVILPILVFIVPQFKQMFAEFGLTLPPPTRLLVRMSDLVVQRPLTLLTVASVVLATIGLAAYWCFSRGLITAIFGSAISGNSFSLVAMSRLANVLAALLELGAPLSEALLLAGRSCQNAYYRDASKALAVHLADPNFTWSSSAVAHNFPLLLLHALSAGESNYPSIPLIRELSQTYSHRAAARMTRQASMSSPIVVIFIGVLVGFVIIALFMPLVQMITSLA